MSCLINFFSGRMWPGETVNAFLSLLNEKETTPTAANDKEAVLNEKSLQMI